MILTDAGPLVALLDEGEASHSRCVAALAHISLPLITTWPALTEAMYLLGAVGGWRSQEALWRLIERGNLQLAEISAVALGRMPALMQKYSDLPMDFADASLVALAEERGLDRIFSLDGDFHVYRLGRGKSFNVLP